MVWKIAVLALAVCVSAASAYPECVCPAIYDPVCGSDGVTYSNNCLLECEQHKKGVFPIKQGSCEDHEVPCVCTFDYRPVCGTDGKTYSNKCELNCSKAKSFVLNIEYEGECHKHED